jgi:hypothetical protein
MNVLDERDSRIRPGVWTPLVLGPAYVMASPTALQLITGNMVVVALRLWLVRGKYQIAPPPPCEGVPCGLSAFDSTPGEE